MGKTCSSSVAFLRVASRASRVKPKHNPKTNKDFELLYLSDQLTLLVHVHLLRSILVRVLVLWF